MGVLMKIDRRQILIGAPLALAAGV
ncbi:MAG: hypothetical protein JWL62_3358, partial [Hyphomicrobiales bacterium]|nr:hypothetical protein [Hyphomicrobiales bacterium]